MLPFRDFQRGLDDPQIRHAGGRAPAWPTGFRWMETIVAESMDRPWHDVDPAHPA